MRITGSAPTRISFFGGSTDLPVFSNKYGGTVISMAINIRQHMVVSMTERMGWIYPNGANKEFYLNTFKNLGVEELPMLIANFDGHIEGGLGTSASAAVLMVEIANRIHNRKMTRSEIAETAWDIEVNQLHLYGGKQDQYAAAFGGLNMIKFTDRVEIDPLPRHMADELTRYSLLFYLGFLRKDAKIQEQFLSLTPEQERALVAINSYAVEARRHLEIGDYESLGKLMNTCWLEKKKSNSRVSLEAIDRVYELALDSGAWGGKVCGSGGGGYMLFMADPKDQPRIVEQLAGVGLKLIDFSPDYQGVETRYEY